MKSNERVVENLNRALHTIFEEDASVLLIGVDIIDPYGGAFKVSKGLSAKYPDRVLATPLSESSIIGVANGLSLCGLKPIVEIMFGDFIALGFDQILNFITKSVSMYGHKLDLNMVIRCPIGGGRAYGPTHSQSLQKHFLGIPNLSLFEMSPVHDNYELLRKLINLKNPCILFEDKILYTKRCYGERVIDDLFQYEVLGGENNYVKIYSDNFDRNTFLIISPGGVVHRCLSAVKEYFINYEVGAQIVVPSQLYPLRLDVILDSLISADHIIIVEESIAGGTWGAEVAQHIYSRLWGQLKNKILCISSKESIIPTAAHLERNVIIQEDDIYGAMKEALGNE